MNKPKEIKALSKALADVLGRDTEAIKSLEFAFDPKHFEKFAGDGGWDGGNIYKYHFRFQNPLEKSEPSSSSMTH